MLHAATRRANLVSPSHHEMVAARSKKPLVMRYAIVLSPLYASP